MKSVKQYLIEVMSQAGRPMTLTELWEYMKRQRGESTGHDDYSNIINTLRSHRELFRKVSRGVWEYVPIAGPIKHDGDCTIYAALDNGRPEDGICTCGVAHRYIRETGDQSCLYSDERKQTM